MPARATTYSAWPRRPGLWIPPPRPSAINAARPNAVQDAPESRAERAPARTGPNEDARRPSAFRCFDQILGPFRGPSTTELPRRVPVGPFRMSTPLPRSESSVPKTLQGPETRPAPLPCHARLPPFRQTPQRPKSVQPCRQRLCQPSRVCDSLSFRRGLHRVFVASRYPTGIDLVFNEAPGGGSVRPSGHDGVPQLARNGSSAASPRRRGRQRRDLRVSPKDVRRR